MSHTFLAEVRKVEAVKRVSNDIEILVTLNTNQLEPLDLGKYPADTIFRVTVAPVDDSDTPIMAETIQPPDPVTF